MARKKVLILTGEISGDIHGYNIAKKLIEYKEIEIHAIGGDKLKSLPIEIIADLSKFSTVGFTAFIPYLSKILKIKKLVNLHIKENRYDLAIFIDNQGFNIPVARKCKKLGIKCMYYFPPIVSIWDRKNAKIVSKIFETILCPFKADHDIYKKQSDGSIFVGHPFVDTVKPDKKKLKEISAFKDDRLLIGLFPGSRYQEINSLLKPMIEAAKIIDKEKKSSFIIGLAHERFRKKVENEIKISGLNNVKIIDKDTYSYIASCDVIVGASGSLAIEAALLHTPMVVTYKVSRLTYLIAKLLIKIKRISWPNIITNKDIYPELLQDKVNAVNIVNNIKTFINKSDNEIKTNFALFKEKIGKPGVINRICSIILKELNINE